MTNIGQRVGAVMQETKTKVYLFGYGTYVGESIPCDEVIFLGRKYKEVFPGKKNAEIKLDNGTVVYGCECWWAPEEDMKNFIGKRKVELVSIKDHRKKGLQGLVK